MRKFIFSDTTFPYFRVCPTVDLALSPVQRSPYGKCEATFKQANDDLKGRLHTTSTTSFASPWHWHRLPPLSRIRIYHLVSNCDTRRRMNVGYAITPHMYGLPSKLAATLAMHQKPQSTTAHPSSHPSTQAKIRSFATFLPVVVVAILALLLAPGGLNR